MEVSDMSFGKNLKKFRELNHFSMDELCKQYNKRFKAKLNKSTLSRYENGRQEPLFSTVVNFATLFQISIDQLLSNASSFEKMIASQEYKLLSIFHSLDFDRKEELLQYAEFLNERMTKKESG